jgi:hypothetical protein
MSDLHQLLVSRLENVRPATEGGWTAMCPICAAAGNGLRGRNQLKVWPSSAFHCVIAGDDREHNKLIRAFLYRDADPDTLAALEVEFVDPEPKLEVEKVYPESMLAKLTPDHRYWMGRGISEEVLRRMGGGLAPADEKGKLSGRYVMPVRDLHGRIIGWTGRLVSDASFGPTHKHLVKSSRCIFPIHDAEEAIRRTRVVVFDEGVGDDLSLATVGIRNRLALLGLNLNARIMGFLASVNPRKIVLSLNNDAIGRAESKSAGNKATEKLRAKLVPFFGEQCIVERLPQSRKDWNLVLRENPEEIRAFAAEVAAL